MLLVWGLPFADHCFIPASTPRQILITLCRCGNPPSLHVTQVVPGASKTTGISIPPTAATHT